MNINESYPHLSDFVLAELADFVALDGKAANANTSRCMAPGEEEFKLCIRETPPEPLTKVVARYYEQLGFTTVQRPGAVYVRQDGWHVKYVVLTVLDDSAMVSVKVV